MIEIIQCDKKVVLSCLFVRFRILSSFYDNNHDHFGEIV